MEGTARCADVIHSRKSIKRIAGRHSKMRKYIDIRTMPDDEKYKWYDKIGIGAKGVKVKEHKSGFPTITIDYKDIHLLTDCLSLEAWAYERKRQGYH